MKKLFLVLGLVLAATAASAQVSQPTQPPQTQPQQPQQPGQQPGNPGDQTQTLSMTDGNSYTVNMFNFGYNVPTFTPVFILNPPINANQLHITSLNCGGFMNVYAKTVIPNGPYTMDLMQSVGNDMWVYGSAPISAIQIMMQQTSFYPYAARCDLVVEPVGNGNGNGNGGNGPVQGNQCLTIEEGERLSQCQQTQERSLECDLLNARYSKFGICQ